MLFTLELFFDFSLLLLAYIFADKFLIPRLIWPAVQEVRDLVTALNIEHGNKKLNGIDRTNDNTPLRKTVHKFNKNFYTITAVTPSDFSLFTLSPNLVNRLLEAVATPLRH